MTIYNQRPARFSFCGLLTILRHLQKATERFNAGLERLLAAGKDGQPPGLLDAGSSLRREIAAAGRSAGPVVGGAAALRRSAAQTVRSDIAHPAVYLLKFMSSHHVGNRQLVCSCGRCQ